MSIRTSVYVRYCVTYICMIFLGLNYISVCVHVLCTCVFKKIRCFEIYIYIYIFR
jgi:hypothetical protein